jgi:MarR family transcriptional regulator, 2-MHQ and catechol-resistance regulon repressor
MIKENVMGTHFRGTDEERRALGVYIKLMRASESTTGRINEHLRDYGLTVSQFGVMEALYHLGSMCQGELARKILKSSGNLTTVIDNLVRDDLVERRRDEADRRMIHIHLTDKGRALIERIFPPHVAGVIETFSVLTPEEQIQLGELLRKLGKA